MPAHSASREIIDAAVERTGLHDLGDDWFRAPFEAYAEDLGQPNLTDRGRGFLRSLAVPDVARRLRVIATLRTHPEIAEVPLPPIVYITGLERSGTTLLYNLLAVHPDARALLRWELMEPVPPPTAAEHATDPRIAAVQASVEPMRLGQTSPVFRSTSDKQLLCQARGEGERPRSREPAVPAGRRPDPAATLRVCTTTIPAPTSSSRFDA